MLDRGGSPDRDYPMSTHDAVDGSSTGRRRLSAQPADDFRIRS
jgi:hypothetical protein